MMIKSDIITDLKANLQTVKRQSFFLFKKIYKNVVAKIITVAVFRTQMAHVSGKETQFEKNISLKFA